MHLSVVVVLLCLVTYSFADKCCFPAQYEAVQGFMRSTVRNGQLSITYGRLFVKFDSVLQKAVFDEYLTVDGADTYIKVIQDFPASKKYVISNGHCKAEPFVEFKRGCIPDSAKELIVGEFGQNALRSVVYDTSFANNPSFMLTQNGTCYPVMEVSAVPDGPAPSMQVVAFMNVTAMVPDPSVFNIPDICKQASPLGK